MKGNILGLFVVLVGALLLSGPISAHHGTVAYDAKNLTTLKGTVTDYQLMNPHTELFFDVKSEDGKIEKWSAEAGSMISMSRLGWTKSMLKPGDQITVVGSRAKNGSFTMRLHKVILPNGKVTNIGRGEDYADQ